MDRGRIQRKTSPVKDSTEAQNAEILEKEKDDYFEIFLENSVFRS